MNKILWIFIILTLIIIIYIFYNYDKYIRVIPNFISINNKQKIKLLNTPLTPLKAKLFNFKKDKKLPSFYLTNPNFLSPVRDQGDCGACWAFVTTSLLSNSITKRIFKFGKNLSVQELLTCFNPINNGCNGAEPEKVLEWLEKTQFKLSINDEYNPKSPKECIKMAEIDGIRVQKDSVISLCKYIDDESQVIKDQNKLSQNIYNMKRFIIEKGSIYATISVYSDFLKFNGNKIYMKDSNDFLGGHAVEIIGWCDKNIDIRKNFNEYGYWICKNSWGKDWSSKYDFPGYFAIRMGFNESGIESRCGSAEPNVNYISRNVTPKNFSIESYPEYVREILLRKK
jgi:C1A family cysteine protease